MSTRLYLPRGSVTDKSNPVAITPEVAGWSFTGLRVIELDSGSRRELVTGDSEMAVLPLAGGCVVEIEGRRFDLQGRADVFSAVTDFAYLPIDGEALITSAHGCRVALPSARATRRHDPPIFPNRPA